METRNPPARRPLAAVLLAVVLASGPAALLLPGLLASPPAAAAVDVEFVNPERFTDIDNHGPGGTLKPAEVLDIVNRHLVGLGQRCLPADRTLAIRVTDLRLAGEPGFNRGWVRNPEVRVMREVDWPSIELSWQLLDAQGTLIDQRTESVADMNYLHHAIQVRDDYTSLPHERSMLTSWFEKRFCARPQTDR